MEARLSRAAIMVAVACSLGASHSTTNFIVTAPSPQFARQVAEAAENYRHDLAIEWLGTAMPRWPQPCPITVQVGPNLGAGGATSFIFQQGHPGDWKMSIQGSHQRILDSVLPHEVTHTIFATHFGRPLPRWADEGGATSVEHVSERQRQQEMLVEFLTTNRGIPFNSMFAMTEYPSDVLPLYAQGYSLARYLIAQGGKQKFVQYVGDGMRSGNWPEATRRHYGYKNLSDLQVTWLGWVRQGSPLQAETGQLASNSRGTGSGQSAGVALASGQQTSAPGQVAVNNLAGRDNPIAMVPVPASGRAVAVSEGRARAPHHNRPGNSRTDGVMLALGEGAPPEPVGSHSFSSVNPAKLASVGQGGWYVRQRDALVTRGGVESNSGRVSAVSRAPLPKPLLPGSTSSTSLARPQGTQQIQPRVLQWNSSSPQAPWGPREIVPSAGGSSRNAPSRDATVNSRPLQSGGTVWR